MTLREDYPYDEALIDLKKILDKCVVHDSEKLEFYQILLGAWQSKSVPMRGIDHKFAQYKKKYELYGVLDESERETMKELIQFWC